MNDICQSSEFLLEEIEGAGVEPGKSFERNAYLALAIERLVHNSHASRAQAVQNLEARRALEGRNAHARRILQAIALPMSCHPGGKGRPYSSTR